MKLFERWLLSPPSLVVHTLILISPLPHSLSPSLSPLSLPQYKNCFVGSQAVDWIVNEWENPFDLGKSGGSSEGGDSGSGTSSAGSAKGGFSGSQGSSRGGGGGGSSGKSSGASSTGWCSNGDKKKTLSRAKAVILGQLVFNRGYFHHCVDDHGFKDAYLFYEFADTAFEENDALLNSPLPSPSQTSVGMRKRRSMSKAALTASAAASAAAAAAGEGAVGAVAAAERAAAEAVDDDKHGDGRGHGGSGEGDDHDDDAERAYSYDSYDSSRSGSGSRSFSLSESRSGSGGTGPGGHVALWTFAVHTRCNSIALNTALAVDLETAVVKGNVLATRLLFNQLRMRVREVARRSAFAPPGFGGCYGEGASLGSQAAEGRAG